MYSLKQLLVAGEGIFWSKQREAGREYSRTNVAMDPTNSVNKC